MAKNLNQVATAATSILPTDKMYIARSPFGVTDDRYILGSDIIAQLDSPLTTKGDLFTFSTVDARLPVGTTNGQILQVNSAAAVGLAWSTATFPTTATNAGRFLRADGTNWVQSTSTLADTYLINTILYAGTANTITGLSPANRGALISSTTGVPSILASPNTTGNYLQANLGAAPSWSTFALNLAGNLTTVGAFDSTFTMTGTTNVTFPTSGTLATTGSIPSFPLSPANGGTGVANTGNLTWGGAITFSGAFTTTITVTGNTSVTLPTSGTIYSTAALITLAQGGTGANLTANTGGIFYSGASAAAILAGTATANQVLLSGATAAPSWSTATYLPTLTANGILFASSLNTMAQIASSASGVLITSAGSVPSISQTLPSAVQGNITAVGTIATGVWQGTPVALLYGGTNAALTASTGGIVYSTATAMAILAGTATAGQMLQSGSTAAPTWSTSVWPATTTVNQVLFSSTTNNVTGITAVNGGVLVSNNTGVPSMLANPAVASKMLLSANAAIPTWSTSTIPTSAGATANKVLLSDGTNYILSTPTFPNASATTRKMIVSDGTNWTASTETWAVPGTSGNILKSDGTNWTSAAASAILPSGTQFNTQSTNLTTTTSISGTTMTDVTGLSVSITPTSSSNKVLVRAIVNISTPSTDAGAFQLVRTSTAIGVGTAAGSRIQVGGEMQANFLNHVQCLVMEFLDSPATTSATTYKVQGLSLQGVAAIQINRSITDTNSTAFCRSSSTITVCEVAV